MNTFVLQYKTERGFFTTMKTLFSSLAGNGILNDTMGFASDEPRREKTELRDFRPGPTQTGLYSLRR